MGDEYAIPSVLLGTDHVAEELAPQQRRCCCSSPYAPLPSVGQASSFAAVAALVVVLPVDGVVVELGLGVACAVEKGSVVAALMFGFAVHWTAVAAAVAAAVVATSSSGPAVDVLPCLSLAAVSFVV